MSGHSHSSNIQRTKSANDLKRVKAFTKVTRDITNAVRMGGGSPDVNFVLRRALDDAKALNLSKEKVLNAVKRGEGKISASEKYFNNIYEILAFNSNYILIEALTDNPNRTVAELRTLLREYDFKLLYPGAAIKFFNKLGEIKLGGDYSTLINILDNTIILDGIIDYNVSNDALRLEVEKDKLFSISNYLYEFVGIKILSSSIVYNIANITSFSQDQLNQLSSFKEELLQMSDIIEVWW